MTIPEERLHQITNRFAVDFKLSGTGLFNQGQLTAKRGLTTTGVANQGNKLALLYLQINVVQGHKRSLRRIKRHFNTG